MKLPEGLVMKKGPDGKIALQMSGKSDYKVSMVGTKDGNFELKFDKPQPKEPPKVTKGPEIVNILPTAQGAKIVNFLPANQAVDKRKIRFKKATPIRAPFLLQNTQGGTKVVKAVPPGTKVVQTGRGATILQPAPVATPTTQANVQTVPLQNAPRIASVGNIVRLPEGQQVFVSEGSASASARLQNRGNRPPTQTKPPEEKKSRPNILSRSNRRKSTPRKVQSIQAPGAPTGN